MFGSSVKICKEDIIRQIKVKSNQIKVEESPQAAFCVTNTPSVILSEACLHDRVEVLRSETT